MSRKRPKPEEIVAKLRQADVLVGQGASVSEVIRAAQDADMREDLHAACQYLSALDGDRCRDRNRRG